MVAWWCAGVRHGWWVDNRALEGACVRWSRGRGPDVDDAASVDAADGRPGRRMHGPAHPGVRRRGRRGRPALRTRTTVRWVPRACSSTGWRLGSPRRCRLAVDPGLGRGGRGGGRVLEVASDPGFEQRVAAAWYVVDGTTDHCLTVDATELDAGTTYYYRFSALGRTSPVGRTAPRRRRCGCAGACVHAPTMDTATFMRIDTRRIVQTSTPFSISGTTSTSASVGHGRTYGLFQELDPLNETVSLDDYRRRYALYRRDEHLQAPPSEPIHPCVGRS